MFNRKFFNMMLSVMMIASLLFGGNTNASAMPMDPTDETKVPHYFGPNPNWALSPLRQADVVVDLQAAVAQAQRRKPLLTPKRAPSPRSPSLLQAAVTPLPPRSISRAWVILPRQPRWLIIPASLPLSLSMLREADIRLQPRRFPAAAPRPMPLPPSTVVLTRLS